MKKKSSSLGINKTSESPPPLRRVTSPSETASPTNYNTYDPRLRHTVNIGLNNNFQRNSGIRSSLQDMSKVKEDDLGFYRNNRYRSTVQSSEPSTVPRYSNTLTPTLAHRNGIGWV